MKQLLRLIYTKAGSLLNSQERVLLCLCILLEVIESDLACLETSQQCMIGVHQLYALFGLSKNDFLMNMSKLLAIEQYHKLEQIMSLDLKFGNQVCMLICLC